MESVRATGSAYQQCLPPALQLHILSFLPPNDRALSGRLVSPDARDSLSGPEHCAASLSQPLPPHAVTSAVAAGQQHVRQLPFRHKLQLLCTAAASGSETNLEVALALLQPSVFPELLQTTGGYHYPGSVTVCGGTNGYLASRSRLNYWDAGVAAVKAGHPQLLGWLLRHCPGFVHMEQVLEAAAEHSSLAALQAVCTALQGHGGSCHADSRVLYAAASSPTPDALAKMEWLVSVCGAPLSISAAAAAARSGDLSRLRWLREQGCPVFKTEVLASALEHTDLAVARWLVDEAGCELLATAAAPAATEAGEFDMVDSIVAGAWGAAAAAAGDRGWAALLVAATRSADGAVKLQWLRERGAPQLEANKQLLGQVTRAAIAAGRVQTVQYLWTAFGAGGLFSGDQAAELAGRSGSIPMLQWLRQAGVELSHAAYVGARRAAVLLWLAQEAGVSAAGVGFWCMQDLIILWPSGTAARDRELLQAVQLMAGAGYSDWRILKHPEVWSHIAKRGDLALVQYLKQQQPQQQQQQQQWSTAGLLSGAAGAGCEALLEWLVEQHEGCLEGLGASCPYLHPAINGDLGTLTALRRLGVPWGVENVVVRAVWGKCSVPVLRWLVEQGAPVGSREEVEEAAARSEWSWLVRDWMVEQGWPVDDWCDRRKASWVV